MSLINVHPPKTYFGSGDIQKSLGSLPGFPWAKYPGEKHLPGHNYTGPGGKYTSIDVHKSQQEREFIVHLSFAEDSNSILEGGGFICRAKINIEKEKRKYSYHLNEDHTKKEMSRNNKTLGIKEIKDNYGENVWRTCRDDNAVTRVSPLKLNVFPIIHDDCLYAWDCETYSEKETNKANPYSCTLINLEKKRKMLDRTKHNFPDLNPTDSVPEEFYDKLMNIVEIFVGEDCIDQMLQRLEYDRKRLILISHNGSGFENWIVFKNAKKLTQCPLKTPRGILSLPSSNPYTDEYLQKKWKRQKQIMGNSKYLQHINFTYSYQHETSSLAAWGNSSNLQMNLRKIVDIDIAKYTEDNWESLRHEWEPYAKRDTLCLGACLIKYNPVMKEVVFQNVSNNLTLIRVGIIYIITINKWLKKNGTKLLEWFQNTLKKKT
ncbi:hypothetical protein LOTGIDRAFT_173056 [Lottia gigantea]|uniref:DNA-directed DNA polymerase n=1 Tax=Lottia gigantea TaxID=225164 RepID=V4AU05_LOTGI|nr:hypothetical protein LOTGIDRAFT_173056 [Lottia gigantea]ESP00788.1 hypothetical protein LOTGIDRAFT_173056 [Lottia gigantea]